MTKKLTKEEVEKKIAFHNKRVSYYEKKKDEISKSDNRIGFRRYD